MLCNLRKGGEFKAFGCSYFNLKAGALSQTHDRAVEGPPRGLAGYTSKAQEEKARICACKTAPVPFQLVSSFLLCETESKVPCGCVVGLY